MKSYIFANISIYAIVKNSGQKLLFEGYVIIQNDKYY
jgi:hypothetical protein